MPEIMLIFTLPSPKRGNQSLSVDLVVSWVHREIVDANFLAWFFYRTTASCFVALNNLLQFRMQDSAANTVKNNFVAELFFIS